MIIVDYLCICDKCRKHYRVQEQITPSTPFLYPPVVYKTCTKCRRIAELQESRGALSLCEPDITGGLTLGEDQ